MKEPRQCADERWLRSGLPSYDDWQPTDWHDVPPRAIALEPAEAAPLSAAQAQSFLEGFNRQMLDGQLLHTRMRSQREAVVGRGCAGDRAL